MYKLFKFFLLLVVFSLPLFGIWAAGADHVYSRFIGNFTARLMLKLQKIPPDQLLAHYSTLLAVVKAHYLNIVPFIALMLAVPSLTWKKRLIGLGLGLIILFIEQIIFTMIASYCQARWQQSPDFHRIFVPLSAINDSMPVVVWLFLAWPGARVLLGEIFSREPLEAKS